MKFRLGVPLLALGVVFAGACSSKHDSPPKPVAQASVVQRPLTIASRTTHFVVREHMLAGMEMQLSGEPFAEAMGRVLSGYSRDWRPANVYFDPSPQSTGPWTDIPGFSSAIESYEYSKQPMNNLAFESGAGVSLAYGPLVNPAGATGAAACNALSFLVETLGSESNATSRFIHPAGDAANPLGWPGIWPTLEPFTDFDPTVAPANTVDESCSITSDDDPGAGGAMMSDDYECDANSLHLVDRASQVSGTISPGASGWAAWKSALWVLNYLQVMHDSSENAVDAVPESQLWQVGVTGNQVQSSDDPRTVAGTFLGSSDIEGFQAGMMITEMDNLAADWLLARSTTDGAMLGGFPDLKTALAYDTNAPLRWFPAQIKVTETLDPDCFQPRPTGYAIADAGSHLLDVAGLLGAYASLYALTDQANTEVGGSQPARAYFDGTPFPADDQAADGESTVHDRALGMMRVALVNLERMHVDPASGIPVDDATVTAGAPSRGTTVAASSAAYTLLALRTVRRSLSSFLALYSNTTPDTATLASPLDAPPFAPGAAVPTISGALNTRIGALASLFYDHMTDASGRAWIGWDVSKGAPTADDDALDAHTAAVRALLVAYLSTGEVKYRDRAQAVFERVESVFWDPSIRLYRLSAGDTSTSIEYTPLRFAMAQAMLRDVYELIASKNGQKDLAALALSRVGRLNKLVLNGWDDRDGDEVLKWPDECALVQDGLPRGGLQMGERTLTGESGSTSDVFDAGPRVIATDRDSDCVPEIAAAKLPAALADSVVFQVGAVQ
ncbi:MAG TPA: hypothetical protein VGI39_43680 [Polyangiaceae bacterium]|jgi:hypothetical protein